MRWKILHRLGSPKWLYLIINKLLPWVSWSSIILLLIGLYWGLFFAPADYLQGDSFRIIYIHVPAAILAESCYILLAVCGIIQLVWKIKTASIILRAATPVGGWMTLVSIVTGCIWAKPTWGSWWVWDARLTSMLILLFLYIGLGMLNTLTIDRQKAEKSSAILAIFGVINIPIIKYSVEWWMTLHQGKTFSFFDKPKMPAEMWMPLLITLMGFYCFFWTSIMLRSRLEIIKLSSRTKWTQYEILSKRGRI